MQETSKEIPAGSLPRSLDVILRHEIVEQARAGDTYDITALHPSPTLPPCLSLSLSFIGCLQGHFYWYTGCDTRHTGISLPRGEI